MTRLCTWVLFVCLPLVACDFNVRSAPPIAIDDVVEPNQHEREHVSKWRIATASAELVLPIPADMDNSFTVDWGDGAIETFTGEEARHIYQYKGIYTVKIVGRVKAWSMSALPHSRLQLLAVEEFGALGLIDMSGAFWQTKNLEFFAGGDTSQVVSMHGAFLGAEIAGLDIAHWDTSSVQDMTSMFVGATAADPDVSGWDTGSVQNMSRMFQQASMVDPDVSGWDTSSVQSMSGMFAMARLATPDVSVWDVSKVQDMSEMFRGALSANPDVSGWDVSNVESMDFTFAETIEADPDVSKWDTGKVSSMRGMFAYAAAANPEVRNWNTSSVESMASMFMHATSADPLVRCWDVSGVIDMRNMFRGAHNADLYLAKWNFFSLAFMQGMFTDITLSTANYSVLLHRLADTAAWHNLALDAGAATHDGSANEARQSLLDRGWKIIDAGMHGDAAEEEEKTDAESSDVGASNA